MNQKYQELKKLLGERLKENVVLAPFTTFKIGGPADLFYEAKTTDELAMAIVGARNLNLPVFILGGGSNILIGDKGIRGIVVKNNTSRIAIRGARGILSAGKTEKGLVYVEADSGVSMNKLVRETIEEGYSGLEMQLGLPGSVGGAVYMNSKWTHPAGAVGDAVYQATILKPDNEIAAVLRGYFKFAYDTSSLQKTEQEVFTAAGCRSRKKYPLRY